MKILKTLAVFSLCSTAAYAAPTMYGKLKLSYGSVSQAGTSLYKLNSNNSRVGFKGSEDFSNWAGVTGFYNIQMGLTTASDDFHAVKPFNTRVLYAGLKGKHGSLKFGRLSYGYKMAALRMDAFYDTSAGTGHGGSNFGQSGKTNGWYDNSFEFISASYMGLVFNAQVVLDESSHNSQNDLNFGLTYTMKDMVVVSLQYLADKDIDAEDEKEYMSANVRGMFGDFQAGLNFETVKTHAVKEEPSETYMYALASWSGLANNKIVVSYGTEENTIKGNDFTKTGSGMTIGSFYSLSKSTTASILYSKVDYEKLAGTKNREVFALGLETNF